MFNCFVRCCYHCKHKMLNWNICITHSFCLIFCINKNLIQIITYIKIHISRNLCLLWKKCLDIFYKCVLIDIHFFNEICNKAVFYCHKAVKKMLLVNFLIAIIVSDFLTIVYCFNWLLSKFVYIHNTTSFDVCFLTTSTLYHPLLALSTGEC